MYLDYYGFNCKQKKCINDFYINITGSSQISKWTSFILSISENGIYTLWDAEVGKCYKLDDTHCPLMKVSRLINHSGVSIIVVTHQFI